MLFDELFSQGDLVLVEMFHFVINFFGKLKTIDQNLQAMDEVGDLIKDI